MEGGIVPNADSGRELHFPSQCRPRDQLAEGMEKLSNAEGSSVQIVPPTKAVVGEGGTEYGLG
jgi:hypothetical protein